MREDWIECTLGEVFDFVGGGTPSKSNPSYWNGNIPWASIKDLKGNHLLRTQDFITEEGLKNSSAKTADANEIILATRISPGTPILSRIKTAINQDLKVVKPKIDSETKYSFWLFNTLKPEIIKLSSGTTVLGITLINLKSIRFLLPPIPIQKAIVNKIEELFSSLDRGIADLKKAQEQLVIYRQAVLKKAFDGVKVFKPLKECGEWKGGGTPSRQVKEYWENGNIPWVSSRDVKTKEIHNTERLITEIAIPNSSTKWIEKDSLLFVMRSGILRRIFPIAIAKVELCVNQDIQTVSLDDNWIPEYVYWFLVGNESDIRHNCSKDGTTVESIDSNLLKSYRVPFCSIQDQKRIIKEIDSRLSVCDKVEESIKESLLKAEALRLSILKKAFEGTLLSEEEIATCKADRDYEPASVLLEKIKAGNKN